jgi:hypothetical protein
MRLRAPASIPRRRDFWCLHPADCAEYQSGFAHRTTLSGQPRPAWRCPTHDRLGDRLRDSTTSASVGHSDEFRPRDRQYSGRLHRTTIRDVIWLGVNLHLRWAAADIAGIGPHRVSAGKPGTQHGTGVSAARQPPRTVSTRSSRGASSSSIFRFLSFNFAGRRILEAGLLNLNGHEPTIRETT